jgi:hypothetical protein
VLPFEGSGAENAVNHFQALKTAFFNTCYIMPSSLIGIPDKRESRLAAQKRRKCAIDLESA